MLVARAQITGLTGLMTLVIVLILVAATYG